MGCSCTSSSSVVTAVGSGDAGGCAGSCRPRFLWPAQGTVAAGKGEDVRIRRIGQRHEVPEERAKRSEGCSGCPVHCSVAAGISSPTTSSWGTPVRRSRSASAEMSLPDVGPVKNERRRAVAPCCCHPHLLASTPVHTHKSLREYHESVQWFANSTHSSVYSIAPSVHLGRLILASNRITALLGFGSSRVRSWRGNPR